MRQVQVNRNLILREDGKLFNIRTGEEYIPPICNRYFVVAIKHVTIAVHRLVMRFFGPPKPGPKYQIDHINRNRLDNNINNLRWVTAKENANNRKDNLPIGHRKCDLSESEYRKERNANQRERRKVWYKQRKQKNQE